MVLQHVNVKTSPKRHSGKRTAPCHSTGTSLDMPSFLQRPNAYGCDRLNARTASLSNSQYRNFSYQDYSFDGKQSNIDLHMLSPTKVLDVVSQGSILVKKSPFYTNYRRKLRVSSGFHKHRDELTELPRKPHIQRQNFHAKRILEQSIRFMSPRARLV
jgi:hypothetical protein